jgi:hypothetical protein
MDSKRTKTPHNVNVRFAWPFCASYYASSTEIERLEQAEAVPCFCYLAKPRMVSASRQLNARFPIGTLLIGIGYPTWSLDVTVEGLCRQ